ncbi:hypothetical protein [Arthrobacter zhaoguopingii]|uniref:hypothetical protein n=1 Tax=Arthrobacter zhaoguopingii TaxID=2681491 RepID=UPI00135BF502|nr:hypothetical protein [Arthrobacter zhaoguopingii]
MDETLAPARATSPQRAARRLIGAAVRRQLATLGRFTEDANAAVCPVRLRRPYSAEQWVGLSHDERHAHVRELFAKEATPDILSGIAHDPPARVRAYLALTEEDRARVDAYEANPAGQDFPVLSAPKRDSAPAPIPSGVPSSVSYVIACAGCGAWLPAASRRPAVRFCSRKGGAVVRKPRIVIGAEDLARRPTRKPKRPRAEASCAGWTAQSVA